MKTFFRFSLIALAFGSFLAVSPLRAQVGNDNRTGPSGIFNGEITTAGSYDPYTGNATRTITDIVVAGVVGTQPLAFARIYNSRNQLSNHFGVAGQWSHNYNWYLDGSDPVLISRNNVNHPPTNRTPSPTSYSLYFPDGRHETFVSSSFDTYYRASAGTRERFKPLDLTTNLAYLILADGSRVEFLATENVSYESDMGPSGWYGQYFYVAQAIIDPYGLRTTLTYDANGNLQKITEPGGRYLQIYLTPQWGEIDHVTATDGRTVQYYYVNYQNTGYPWQLDHVVYYGDPTLTGRYTYCASNVSGVTTSLLRTADDPMYAGPMKRIAYVYRTTNNQDVTKPVYGQLQSENYYDGTNVGAALTTLTVNGNVRTETRADTKTRTFTYGSALLSSCTDFKGISASQTYDSNFYINSVTDRRGQITNFTANTLTGILLTTTFPQTPATAPGAPRGVIAYTYGSASCPDSNNRDPNNPYYICSATDEGGHTTFYYRDSSKRVTQINYPDGGTESFTYNSFNQILTHTMKTGGLESFSYDARGLKQTYRDPYHASGNPTARYQYDALDRVSGVTDALGSASGDLNHTTSYSYNSRGQVLTTTHPVDPIDNQRHMITNAYNPDGTRKSVTDELNHITSYTYDDYRRPRSVTTPGHNTAVTAYSYYDANGTGEDYSHTDANVTHTVSPSGKKGTIVYDENRRKITVTVAVGTSDAATTSYGYDNNGNLTSVISPKEQSGQPFANKSTTTGYDARNRIGWIKDPLGNTTSFTYDAAGRKASITRSNGQVTTFDSYDAMNRLLQQTVQQDPSPDAVTKYTYYTSGLLHTMQDPHLVASNSSYTYSYSYDQMGRKTGLMYPPDSGGTQQSEAWHFDTAGRNDTFTNRAGKVQTNTYDALNRKTGFSWNDGLTPSVSFGYDVASRMTSVTNANATISRTYFNDNLLNTETATYADNTARTVTYTYDADGNRATIQYPNGAYAFTYNYTNRNQLYTLVNNSTNSTVITYGYDPDGNLATRAPANGTSSSYTYDELDRATNISHALNGTTRTLDYAYDSVGNRKWAKRDGGNGDVFGYDLSDQVTATQLDIANPDTTAPGSQTIMYDANGNRTTFSAYGSTDTYTTNNLNQYTARNSSTAAYDNDGNITTGLDGSTYTYDAQNRLLTATKGGSTQTYKYDGLNRQVSRTTGSLVYNVYDGWDLIGEYNPSATTPLNVYLYGAGGLVKRMTPSNSSYYYYQDASGSTTHLADSSGNLVEWYRYDLQGKPFVYSSSGTLRSVSANGIRHLFTGQQWYNQMGLYDMRNRFYSPDTGRFLQGDPSGFNGDATNLYRYCGNNPLKRSDPTGLHFIQWRTDGARQYGGRDFNDGGSGWPLPLGGGASGVSDAFISGATTLFRGAICGTKSADWAFLSSPNFNGSLDVPQGTVTVGPITAVSDNSSNGGSSSDASSSDPPASQVRMIDQENSFSPSDWSDQQYNLQWSVTHNGDVVSSGTIDGITPRQAYAQSDQVGFATAPSMVPGQSVTYNFVSYSPDGGFVYNGWSVTATVIDPWGIGNTALQNRVNLQNQGVIPAGVPLGHEYGGGLSTFLYGQLPSSIQYNGYYYAAPGGH